MNTKLLSLGIDTSNYKTSVAIVDRDSNIIFNHQKFLTVKKGERGLRQSDAFFQHIQALPDVIKTALDDDNVRTKIGSISVSTRPRPARGSYMPVFTAGMSIAKTLSAGLNVPLYEFSHQEGHIEAVKHYSKLKNINPLICFHFSGGTTEAVLVDNDKNIFQIVGGSKDLAYGQVLDRVGVALGFDFPSGEALDDIAMKSNGKNYQKSFLKDIKVNDGYINLSGIETQAQRAIGVYGNEELVSEIFSKVGKSILEMTVYLSNKYKINNFIYAGGVSCSRYIRTYLDKNMPSDIVYAFGDPKLSSDNAVGIALLGGNLLWR